MSDIRSWAVRIQGRIAEVGVRKADLARELGIDASAFSAVLNGRRTPPEGFEARVTAALDRLERAERAADTARQKVLGKGAVA